MCCCFLGYSCNGGLPRYKLYRSGCGRMDTGLEISNSGFEVSRQSGTLQLHLLLYWSDVSFAAIACFSISLRGLFLLLRRLVGDLRWHREERYPPHVTENSGLVGLEDGAEEDRTEERRTR